MTTSRKRLREIANHLNPELDRMRDAANRDDEAGLLSAMHDLDQRTGVFTAEDTPSRAANPVQAFLAKVDEMFGDLNLLREAAVGIDKETGKEYAKSPSYLAQQIKLKQAQMEVCMKVASKMAKCLQSYEFSEIVIRRIGENNPETRDKILADLAVLYFESGLGVSAPDEEDDDE
jgi:hypothetical protein